MRGVIHPLSHTSSRRGAWLSTGTTTFLPLWNLHICHFEVYVGTLLSLTFLVAISFLIDFKWALEN